MQEFENLVKYIYKYDHSFMSKINLYRSIRVLEKIWYLDNDEIQGLKEDLVQAIYKLDEKQKSSIKLHARVFKALIQNLKKKHGELFDKSIYSPGMSVAATSTPGGVNSNAGGVVSAGVLIGSKMKFDDGSKKK